MPKKKEKYNQDIIDFRYMLIEAMYGKGVLTSNDNTYPMTEETRLVLEDVLETFNIHFSMRNYDIG